MMIQSSIQQLLKEVKTISQCMSIENAKINLYVYVYIVYNVFFFFY